MSYASDALIDAQRNTINRLKTENERLRELAKDACTVLRGFFDPEWFDETVFAERMHELGIEIEVEA